MKGMCVDVAIIGGGPVGLFCAFLLNQQGLNCRIFDKKKHLSEHSKALALHIRTLQMFKDCGLIDGFLELGQKIRGLGISTDTDSPVIFNFENISHFFNYFIDLPQNITEKIIYDAISSKGIDVEWEKELINVEQFPENIKITLKDINGGTDYINAKWLIACDGYHSPTRELLKLKFIGKEYPEKWWLADVYIDWSLPEDHMFFFPSVDGPLGCFPMGKKRYRIILKAETKCEENPTLEEIQNNFNLRSGLKVNLYNPIWVTKFYVHRRQIEHYRKDRIFFAGDAAHVHSPAGGQGLNTGFQDVYNLVWKLSLVKNGLAHEVLLDSYEQERKPIGAKILRKTGLMHRVLSLKNKYLIKLRNTILKFVLSNKFLSHKFSMNLSEMDIKYSSDVILNKNSSLYLSAGEFFDDFALYKPNQKKATNIHDAMNIRKHHLLLFSGLSPSNDLNHLKSFINYVNQHYSEIIQIHCIGYFADSIVDNVLFWEDRDFNVHKNYNIRKKTAVLIRPDMYIGLSVCPFNPMLIKKYLKKLFIRN
jgi:hypothetical protein